MKRYIVSLSLALACFAISSLGSGADWLGEELPGGLPLGNALTAIGLCAIAGAAFALTRRGTAFRIVALSALVGAAVWLPVSIVLAGNAALNFTNGLGSVWLIFSLTVAAVGVVSLAWASVAALFRLRSPDTPK